MKSDRQRHISQALTPAPPPLAFIVYFKRVCDCRVDFLILLPRLEYSIESSQQYISVRSASIEDLQQNLYAPALWMQLRIIYHQLMWQICIH